MKKWRGFLIGLVITCLIGEQVCWVVSRGTTTETLHPRTKLSSSIHEDPQTPLNFSSKRNPSFFNRLHLNIPILTMVLLMLYHFAYFITGHDTLLFDHARMGFFVLLAGIVSYLLFLNRSVFEEESDGQFQGLFDEAQRDYMGISKGLAYVRSFSGFASWLLFSALTIIPVFIYWDYRDFSSSLSSVEQALIYVEQAVFIALNGYYFYQMFLKGSDKDRAVRTEKIEVFPFPPLPPSKMTMRPGTQISLEGAL